MPRFSNSAQTVAGSADVVGLAGQVKRQERDVSAMTLGRVSLV